LVHLEPDKAFHFGHERAEVVGFLAADIGQALQEDVEVLLAFVVGWGSVACGAFEDVGETAGDVVELLFLMVDKYVGCKDLRQETVHLPCQCRVSPKPPTLRWP
jgi:hypothetical protein